MFPERGLRAKKIFTFKKEDEKDFLHTATNDLLLMGEDFGLKEEDWLNTGNIKGHMSSKRSARSGRRFQGSPTPPRDDSGNLPTKKKNYGKNQPNQPRNLKNTKGYAELYSSPQKP